MSRRGWPHVDDPEAVARRLKEARLRAGLSQRELSFPGCTAVYICRIEQGDRVPSLQILRELARRLGVSEEWLATGDEAPGAADPLLEADVALRLDQRELAEHLFTRALEGAGSATERGRALAGLGQIDFHAGRVADAIERLEEARELLGAADPAVAETLGRAYAMVNRYPSAIAVLRAALERACRRGETQDEARFAVLLSNALIDSGNLPEARSVLGAAVTTSEELRDPIAQARVYWSQSRLHTAEKNHDAAAHYARMALAAIDSTEHVTYGARAYQLLAYIELERGNAEEALALLERGYPLVQRSGDAHAEAVFRLERARALAQLGRLDEAAPLALEIAGVLREIGADDAGRAYATAGEIFERLGEPRRALELYELALEVVDGAPTYGVDIYARMARLLENEGRKDEALDLLKLAVGLRAQTERTTG
jgi:tetratricopeptide (TPR) repeat protein